MKGAVAVGEFVWRALANRLVLGAVLVSVLGVWVALYWTGKLLLYLLGLVV